MQLVPCCLHFCHSLLNNFQITGISLISSSFLKIMAQRTGTPVPEMNCRTVKCSFAVALVGAVVLPEFFGTINTSPPTLPSINWFVLQSVLSATNRKSSLVNYSVIAKLHHIEFLHLLSLLFQHLPFFCRHSHSFS
jgi:hypothetical protein